MAIRTASGGRQLAWTKDQILEGVVKFIDEHKCFQKLMNLTGIPICLAPDPSSALLVD